MTDQIARVKDATDIITLIGERVKLTKSGSNYKGLCPFHSEKSPSFFVNPAMQRYTCFGCHETGDVFTFLENYDTMTFAESLNYLAKRAGIILESFVPSPADHKRERVLAALSLAREYYHYLLTDHPAGEKAREYLQNRGTNSETITLFSLGVSLSSWDGLQKYLIGKKGFSIDELLDAGLILQSERGTYYDRFRDRLMFPLTNTRGIVVGFSGRSLETVSTAPDGHVSAKYINSPETITYHKSELLFGYSQLHRFIREREEVILVEGEFDMLSSYQAHVQNVCAIKGSALTQEQLKLLSRSVKRILFALDNDKAGIEATKRAIGLAQEFDISLRVILLSGGKDPDEIARENPVKWREMSKKSVTVYDYLIDQSFLSHDLSSGDGKKEITNELGPLILGISNAVEQVHYLQKIAKRLEVSEDIVFGQFRRKELPIPVRAKEKVEPERVRDRGEVLEEYLFSLLFHMEGKEFAKANGKAVEIIRSPILRKILQAISQSREYQLADFSATLPEELKSLFFALYMRDDEEITKLELPKEFDSTILELSKFLQKKDREDLAVRITELESKTELTPVDSEELIELQAKMMNK